MGGWRLSALALLSVALLDSSPATAARGAASAVPQTGPSALPCGGAAAGRHLLGIGLRTELSETDGVNRAGAELEKIIHQRDIEMQKRARYVESKMHDMVTKPWATVHPLKLKRDERRDEALVRHMEHVARTALKLDFPDVDQESALTEGRLSLGFHKWPMLSVRHLHLHCIYPMPCQSWWHRFLHPQSYGWLYAPSAAFPEPRVEGRL